MPRRSFDPFSDRELNRLACKKHLADLRRCETPLASIVLVEHVPLSLRQAEWRNACPMEIDDSEKQERRAYHRAYVRDMKRRKRAQALRLANVGA